MLGIFSDEGCLEHGIYTREEAEKRLAAYPDDDAFIAECCDDHPEQTRDACEDCNTEGNE